MLSVCVDVANTALVPHATETCAVFTRKIPRPTI